MTTIYIIRKSNGHIVTTTNDYSASTQWVRALVKWHSQDGACKATTKRPPRVPNSPKSLLDRAVFNYNPFVIED